MPDLIRICADLAPGEVGALDSAVDTLNRLLLSAIEDAPRIEWRSTAAADARQTTNDIRIMSLLVELAHVDLNWPEHERMVREKLGAQRECTAGPIFLTTIFRHVAFDGVSADRSLLLRLRRLNLLALELSRETGVTVIDIDRALADIGANLVLTDYRLDGSRAAALAGFAMAQVLLMDAFPDFLAASSIDQIAKHLDAERPVFDGADDWPEFVRSSWLSGGTRRGFGSAATIYDDFDPNYVALQLKRLLQGKVTMASAVKAIRFSAGRHGVKATARRLWNGAAQLRKSINQ